MKRPKITLVMTLHERPIETVRAVLRSVQGQGADHVVLVFDGTPDTLKAECRKHATFESVDIVREPGWRCSSAAWNVAYGRIDTELTFQISSDVVLEPDAVALARQALSDNQCIIFGKCTERDAEVAAADRNTTPVLCSSTHPRPLGFIMAMPTWALRRMGGYDEGMMSGYWYEDDDFTMRLWQVGLPFVFTDKISGVHQTHPRSFLTAEKIELNRQYMLKKWGHEHPLQQQRIVQSAPAAGIAVWSMPPVSYTVPNEKDAQPPVVEGDGR